MRKKRAYKLGRFQYYNFKDQFNDIIPYFHISLSSGFVGFGWIWTTLSAFILPKIKLCNWKYSCRYFKLIDRKLYLLYNIADISTPRILVTKTSITFIVGFIQLEYER